MKRYILEAYPEDTSTLLTLDPRDFSAIADMEETDLFDISYTKQSLYIPVIPIDAWEEERDIPAYASATCWVAETKEEFNSQIIELQKSQLIETYTFIFPNLADSKIVQIAGYVDEPEEGNHFDIPHPFSNMHVALFLEKEIASEHIELVFFFER